MITRVGIDRSDGELLLTAVGARVGRAPDGSRVALVPFGSPHRGAVAVRVDGRAPVAEITGDDGRPAVLRGPRGDVVRTVNIHVMRGDGGIRIRVQDGRDVPALLARWVAAHGAPPFVEIERASPDTCDPHAIRDALGLLGADAPVLDGIDEAVPATGVLSALMAESGDVALIRGGEPTEPDRSGLDALHEAARAAGIAGMIALVSRLPELGRVAAASLARAYGVELRRARPAPAVDPRLLRPRTASSRPPRTRAVEYWLSRAGMVCAASRVHALLSARDARNDAAILATVVAAEGRPRGPVWVAGSGPPWLVATTTSEDVLLTVDEAGTARPLRSPFTRPDPAGIP